MFLFSKKMKEVTIAIEGMSCNHCTASVKKAVMALDGVKSADVSLQNKNAVIKYDESKINAQKIVKCINELDFKATIGE